MINYKNNNELRYMINAVQYLEKEYDKQHQDMEWFARWDLAEEIGMEWIDAKGLSAAWKSASNGISRELRRANVKYATKQIAKYTAEKLAIKTSAKIAIGRLTFGAIGNAFVRWKLGY